MKRNLPICRGMFVAMVMLTMTVVARAAEEGGGPDKPAAAGAFQWIHFALLVIAGYWLFKKVLPPVFRRNADKISAAISKASAAKDEAERLLKEAEEKLASLEQEVAHFRAQAQGEAAAELERLRGMMKVDIEKAGLAGKAEIEAAERAARVELKALAAKLAVDRAESLAAKQMTPAIQEAMVNNFVHTLQGRPN
jgi:F-type H+-transporting ATPase subunit b